MKQKSACKTAKLTILSQGPYELCGKIPLRQERMVEDGDGGNDHLEHEKSYDHPEITHLCRCGHSKKKPFCDGTHLPIGFEGIEYATKEAYEEGAMYYQGPALDLVDKEPYCTVARFCHYGQGTRQDVADSNLPEAKKRAMFSACNCISGRLTVVDKERNLIEPALEPAIGIIEDVGKDCKGPLFVQGGIEVKSSDGTSYPVRNRQTLCRCGESRNMPFCDASHLRCEHMQGIDP